MFDEARKAYQKGQLKLQRCIKNFGQTERGKLPWFVPGFTAGEHCSINKNHGSMQLGAVNDRRKADGLPPIPGPLTACVHKDTQISTIIHELGHALDDNSASESESAREKRCFGKELKYTCWLLTVDKYKLPGPDKTQLENIKEWLEWRLNNA